MFLCLGGILYLVNPESLAAVQTRKSTKAKVTKTRPAIKYPSERGYVAGYSDGYVSGKTDFNTDTPKDFQRSTLYSEANRGYEKSFGDLSEFEAGYKQGYELGYGDGYAGRAKNDAIPPNLSASAAAKAGVKPVADVSNAATAPSGSKTSTSKPAAPVASRKIVIAPDMDFRLRLEDKLSTKTSQAGDQFRAVVIEPLEYENLIVEGKVADIKRAGKLTGQTQMSLSFDSIQGKDGVRYPFHGQLVKVFATEKVKTIDEEGNVQTGSTTKDTTIRTAGGGALGAIIGGIAGGGKGAAIGAILGATVGAGSVYIQGNKDLTFEPGTEIQVKTAGPKR